jgi:hypothetical protein
MNNEPVAWVEEDNINMSGYQFDFQFVAFNRKPKSEADWIPLYTHPVKELTDEEIVSLYESSYLQSGLDEWEFDPVYFAKAILRKAQENG